MPQLERHTFYIPDALVNQARERGITNLSQFVREALKEYVKAGTTACKQSVPAATPMKEGILMCASGLKESTDFPGVIR